MSKYYLIIKWSNYEGRKQTIVEEYGVHLVAENRILFLKTEQGDRIESIRLIWGTEIPLEKK